jgi:fumarate reductase flavoprotein subunit
VDCSTASPGLFAAGEDCGGVHGANRLGGNGVANSTVFGGIAGESMARWTASNPGWRAPDEQAIARSIADHTRPFSQAPGNLEAIREALYDCMWNDVGILRDAAGLRRAQRRLAELEARLLATGVPAGDLNGSTFTVARMGEDGVALSREPVRFERVRPGATILQEEAAGAPS